ncbi:hypothetical protein KIF59_00395 [Enterobacter cloacae subsp. cloacae]|nr:hypothetical protein [Enterobacter cloacae subsp. cloacae]
MLSTNAVMRHHLQRPFPRAANHPAPSETALRRSLTVKRAAEPSVVATAKPGNSGARRDPRARHAFTLM